MPITPDQLYELLPTVHRLRDAERGEPLKALVTVLAEQAAMLEDDITRLYDNWFIETCDEWLVPYIGDLLAARGLYSLRGMSARTSAFSQRARVANTIAYRRRKGTAAMLEQLARDVTGWDARAVEFFELLATTQNVNHVRKQSLYTPDLRDAAALERLNTPFDTIAHTGEVRHIDSRRGKYNIPNVGIFLWRLQAYPLTSSPAVKVKVDDNHDNRFFISPLGCNSQLFTHPETETEITHLAGPINAPIPISRLRLHDHLSDYYGDGRSIAIKGDDEKFIEQKNIIVCNLSDDPNGGWAHTTPKNKVAIDPVLGRLRFGSDYKEQSPSVAFYYGFSADLGGGEYDREKSINAALTPVKQVPASNTTIQDILDAVKDGGAVEILDSGRYVVEPGLSVEIKNRVELRSVNEHRATIVLKDDSNDPTIPPIFSISGDAGAELILNGLLIIGGTLNVTGKIKKLTLRHCTLVPGLSVDQAGKALYRNKPSLIVATDDDVTTIVEIDHCILGALELKDNVNVEIRDSIIDGLGESVNVVTGNRASIERSTILGGTTVKQLDLGSETIFMQPVKVTRRQEGCMRFSYVPNGSSTPRCYRCQPDLALNGVKDVTQQNAIRARLAPSFTSLRYGDAAYAQLSMACAEEITTGAEDGSEMGAFSFLKQAQRLANLQASLDEYLRFGLEAGIFFAS